MKIRIQQPTTVRLELEPGDEIVVKRPSPAVTQLLSAVRLDGERVARVVDDDDCAVTDQGHFETATVSQGRKGATRTAVSQ